jgi:hypothetical protein
VGENKDVSVKLTSKEEFLAERPMYFDYQGPKEYSYTGGHDIMGLTAPSGEWFFAEGYTGEAFDEWICIQNPGGSTANVEITYYTQEAGEIKTQHTVGANSRYTVYVNEDAGENLSLSARVVSDQPVVCERPMYFNYRGEWNGGHAAAGVSRP